MTYDAVVFDLDGVLLTGRHTPTGLYDRAVERVLAAAGIDDPPAALRSPSDVAAFRRACEEHGLEADDLVARYDRAANALENAVIDAGEREPFADVSALDDLGVPLGIVSNNRHGTVEYVVERFDLGVGTYYGREPSLAGFERRKPAPYYLERACADLGVDPGATLYVGDRRSDVETAHNVGADGALLTREGAPADGEPAPAHHVETLRDLSGLV